MEATLHEQFLAHNRIKVATLNEELTTQLNERPARMGWMSFGRYRYLHRHFSGGYALGLPTAIRTLRRAVKTFGLKAS